MGGRNSSSTHGQDCEGDPCVMLEEGLVAALLGRGVHRRGTRQHFSVSERRMEERREKIAELSAGSAG